MAKSPVGAQTKRARSQARHQARSARIGRLSVLVWIAHWRRDQLLGHERLGSALGRARGTFDWSQRATGTHVRTSGAVACWAADTYGESTPPAGTFGSIAAAGTIRAQSDPAVPSRAGAMATSGRHRRRRAHSTRSQRVGSTHALSGPMASLSASAGTTTDGLHLRRAHSTRSQPAGSIRAGSESAARSHAGEKTAAGRHRRHQVLTPQCHRAVATPARSPMSRRFRRTVAQAHSTPSQKVATSCAIRPPLRRADLTTVRRVYRRRMQRTLAVFARMACWGYDHDTGVPARRYVHCRGGRRAALLRDPHQRHRRVLGQQYMGRARRAVRHIHCTVRPQRPHLRGPHQRRDCMLGCLRPRRSVPAIGEVRDKLSATRTARTRTEPRRRLWGVPKSACPHLGSVGLLAH